MNTTQARGIRVLIFTVFLWVSVSHAAIIQQFATTNTGPTLTNIILSMAGGGSQVWTNVPSVPNLYPSDNTNNPPYVQFFKGAAGGAELHLESQNNAGSTNISTLQVTGKGGGGLVQASIFGNVNDGNPTSWSWNIFNYQASPGGEVHFGLFFGTSDYYINMDPMFDNGIEAFRFSTVSNVSPTDVLFSVENQLTNKAVILGNGTVEAGAFRTLSNTAPADVGGITYNLTVVTNGANTATLHFTNGVLMSVTAP